MIDVFAMLSRGTTGIAAAGNFATEGALTFGAPLMAFEAATADRGEVVPSLATSTAGLLAAPIVTGIVGGVLSVLFPGIGTGMAMSLVSGAVAGEIIDSMSTGLRKRVRHFTELDQRVRRLQMGGHYQDTEFAQRQRMSAIQSMNAASIPARRYLGQEALLFHR